MATARRAGELGTREQHAFDALMDLASRSHRVGARPAPHASRLDPDAAGRAPDGIAPVPGRENLRHLGLIRVDLTALLRGDLGDGELCEIAGIGPVPVGAARDLLGESILKLVITRGVDVLNVTHLGRGPTVAQQVALLWSHPVCCVRGCNRVRRLEWDHRTPWAKVRRTELGNTDGLCGFHHARKTRDGWELIDDTDLRSGGRREMIPPSDPRHPRRAARARAPSPPRAATGPATRG